MVYELYLNQSIIKTNNNLKFLMYLYTLEYAKE